MIEQGFQLAGRVSFVDQMEQHAWIKIARPGSHHETAGWGQTHAGVDRYTILQRRHAGAIAQVRDDGAAPNLPSQFAHNIFVGKTMEAVALDSLLPEFTWQSKAPGDLRNPVVKRRVKTSHL